MQLTFSTPQPQGYSSRKASKTALIATIGVHVLVIGGVWMMPAHLYERLPEKILWIDNIPAKADPPPPTPRVEPKVDTASKTVLTPDKPKTDTLPPLLPPLSPPDDFASGKGAAGDGAGTVERQPPVAQPVLIDAMIDPKRAGDFQPEYPGAMIRQQMEGKVTVRVRISAQGRVEEISLIEATNPAFWEATRSRALSRWRFRPATRDGVPVVSERVMTVRFRLADL